VVKEEVKNHWTSMLIRFRRYRPPLLPPEQAYSLTVLPTYTGSKHSPNSSLTLVLYVVGVKELWCTNLPYTPLPSIVPWLHPALVALADLVPLLIRPVRIFFYPRKTCQLEITCILPLNGTSPLHGVPPYIYSP